MKIVLPWPDSRLTPNSKRRKHWTSYRPVIAKARQDATWATIASEGFHDYEPPADGAIPGKVTFFPPGRRRRADDGMIGSFKHARDGVADALDVADSRFATDYHIAAPEKPGRVEVEIG